MKICKICGFKFETLTRQKICSDYCKRKANCERVKKYVKKHYERVRNRGFEKRSFAGYLQSLENKIELEQQFLNLHARKLEDLKQLLSVAVRSEKFKRIERVIGD